MINRHVTLFLVLTACILLSSCSIAEIPKGSNNCTPLPYDFSEEYLIGTWMVREKIDAIDKTDILVIKADGTYKQFIRVAIPQLEFEGDWQRWWYEPGEQGVGYLHLENWQVCGMLPEEGCELINSDSRLNADFCNDI
jgi:hypothetical protein